MNLFFSSIENHFQFLKRNNFFQIEIDMYLPEFAVGGISFVLIEWIKNDMKKSPEEMGHIVSNFMNPKYLSA